jgi:pimeloyl-ACP methyl ester carboxylesterase
MTTSPGFDDELNDLGSPAADRERGRRRRRVRRRRVIASTILLVVAGLLLANTLLVNGQEADATGNSVLSLSGVGIQVSQDGPREAPALVLIHGLGASTRWWDRVLPMLVSSYHVIRVDLLGHGRSAKPAGGGYAVPQQAHRVGQAMDQLGIRHAVLVGHSTGGYVATALAEQRPDLVTALALIDTGPRLDAFVSDGTVGRLVDVPVVGQLLWRLRTDGIIRRGLSTAFAPGFTAPRQVVEDTRAMTYHGLTAASHASDDYLGERPLPDRLSALGKPVLVIFGERDRRWQPSSVASYRTLAGARMEVIPGVGHSPMLEDPPRTAALLLSLAGSVIGGH